MHKRVNRGKIARGGANIRKYPSKVSTWIHENNLDKGNVLDYGCGYGIDADTYGWYKYDPYYLCDDIKEKKFDVIICTNVLSAVSRKVREEIITNIQSYLKTSGTAYLNLPRNLPKTGKLSGYNRRPQNYVVLNGLETIRLEKEKYEIVVLKKDSKFIDKTIDVA